MTATPLLETNRLFLEPFPMRLLTDRYVSWLNDPEVVRYSEQRHKHHTIESCRHFVESFVPSPSHLWAINANDPELGHIGNIHADVDAANRVADIAILIGERRVWGHGYGLEAWMAVCDWLVRAGGMRKVTAGTLAENAAMLAVMRKSDMKDDGIRPRHYLFEGREIDIVHMAMYAGPDGKR